MTLAYIAIGSNLGCPKKIIISAVKALSTIPDSIMVSVSSYYKTIPLGPKNQPHYLNAAVSIETKLSPESLLDKIQHIELEQGRNRNKRQQRWSPRTLDLDIMLFGDKIINTNRLIVPHYDIKNRDFMLWPLFEIAPHLCFPDGLMLETVLSHLGKEKPPYFQSW